SVWAAEMVYFVNNYVIYNGKKYRCTKDHISSYNNNPASAVGQVFWEPANEPPPIDPPKPPPTEITDWADNTHYIVGNVAITNGDFYSCIKEHISRLTNNPISRQGLVYWSKLPPLPEVEPPKPPPTDPSVWDDNTEYIINNIVFYEHKVYKC